MDAKHIRSELWLVLAHAFLPPSSPEVAQAFVAGLAEDLAELASPLGLDIAEELENLSRSVRDYAEPEALLIEYSRVFFPPWALATLNLARYVDGSINGPCLDALEAAYGQIGLAPGERLRDLPDHAAIQLECVAYLAGGHDQEQERNFARLCLVGALPHLARTLETEAPGSPYTALARIASKAIGCHAAPLPAEGRRKRRRHDSAVGVWRHCQNCEKTFAREKEIRIMAKALKEAGLPYGHLGLCPECRDATRGFFKRMTG